MWFKFFQPHAADEVGRKGIERSEVRVQVLECMDLSALSVGDASPSDGRGRPTFFHGPLDAALLWRLVAKGVKAVNESSHSKSAAALCRYPSPTIFKATEGFQSWNHCLFPLLR